MIYTHPYNHAHLIAGGTESAGRMREASDCRMRPVFTFRNSHDQPDFDRRPSPGRAQYCWRLAKPGTGALQGDGFGGGTFSVDQSPVLLREPLAGTNVHTFPGTLGHLPALFPQFKWMNCPSGPGKITDLISPYKRGGAGSHPAAPTKFVQLDGLFETLNGGPVTTAGNHRCMLPGGGRVPSGHGSIPFDHQGVPRRRPPAAPRAGRATAVRCPADAHAGRRRRYLRASRLHLTLCRSHAWGPSRPDRRYAGT